MTSVLGNTGLVVIRRSGDCHALCARPRGCSCGHMSPQQLFEARPPRRAISAEAGGLPKVVEHRLAPERQSRGSRIPPAPLGFFSWALGLVERHKANLILSRLLASEMTLVTVSQ